MVLDLGTLIKLISDYSQWGIPIPVIAFLVWFVIYLLRTLLDEDRSARLRARFYKALYKVSGKSEVEKKYRENDVTSRINLARRNMPFAKSTYLDA